VIKSSLSLSILPYIVKQASENSEVPVQYCRIMENGNGQFQVNPSNR
jgi:hypothetical protein